MSRNRGIKRVTSFITLFIFQSEYDCQDWHSVIDGTFYINLTQCKLFDRLFGRVHFEVRVTDACIAGRPVRFGLLSRGIAIARDMFAISRE
jgi:hypothetical protein